MIEWKEWLLYIPCLTANRMVQCIGVWGGGGQGGAPQLLGNSVFWAAAVLFLGSSNGGRGVFFNFPEGGWRHADNVQGGGGACEIPPFRKLCIRACYLCKILGNQPLRPPNQSVPIRLWSSACMHVCICMYVYIVTCLTSWYWVTCHHGFDRYVANVICEKWTTLKNGLWPNVMFQYK